VSPHRFGLVAEEDAGLAVAGDGVLAEDVVGVLVADGDAVAAIAADLILLEQAMLDPPADVQAVLPVANPPIPAQHRILRAAARVQAQAPVLLGQAILDEHAPRYLEADPVSLVVADNAVADGDALAFEQIDAAAATAVQIHRLVAVAGDGQPLDG